MRIVEYVDEKMVDFEGIIIAFEPTCRVEYGFAAFCLRCCRPAYSQKPNRYSEHRANRATVGESKVDAARDSVLFSFIRRCRSYG